MTTSTGLVSQLQETEPIAARNCTPSARYAFAQSTSTAVAQPFTTVETREPHFSAELVMTPNQPPPVAIGRPPQHRMDAAPPPAPEMGPSSPAELAIVSHQSPQVVQQRMDASPPAPRRCSCNCLVCTRFCRSCINFRPCMSASSTPIVEENIVQNHITSCQLCPRWMTLPVQESLSGYDGPSALV